MTQPELFYSFSAAGTQLATFTTEASLMGGYPIPQIPATFFNKLGTLSSSLKIRAYGQVGTTSAPTFTMSLRLLSSGTAAWSAGGLLLGSTGATPAASTVTLAPWQLDVDVILRTIASDAATSSLSTSGTLGGAGFPASGSMPANNVSSVSSTLDVTGGTQYYLWLSCACGTSSASNLINMQGMKIYLEN
jgi:hypothetical protein